MIKIRGRKGQIREAVIVVAIVVIILGIIVLKPFSFLASKIDFFDFRFEKSKEDIKSNDILRYDITENSVSYFNGEKFVILEKEGKLNGRDVDGDEIREEFENFYYDESERGERKIELNRPLVHLFVYMGLDDEEEKQLQEDNPFIDAEIERIESAYNKEKENRGGIKINLIEKDSNKPVKNVDLFFNIKNELIFRYNILLNPSYPGEINYDLRENKIDYSGNALLIPIIETARDWRDSVFNKPIGLLGKEYCAELQAVRYIIVELAKEGEGDCFT